MSMSTYKKWFFIRLTAWVNILAGLVLLFVTYAHTLAWVYFWVVPSIFMIWSSYYVTCQSCGSNIALKPKKMLGVSYFSAAVFFPPRSCWRCGANLRTQFPPGKDRQI